MTVTPPTTVDVSYSVKELFEKVDRKLDRISEQIDNKADKSHVASLEIQIDELKGDIAEFKVWRAKIAGISGAIGALMGGGAAGIWQMFG